MSDEKMMPTDVERVALVIYNSSARIKWREARDAAVAVIAALAHPPQARDEVQRVARIRDQFAAMATEARKANGRHVSMAAELVCEAAWALAALPPVDPAEKKL